MIWLLIAGAVVMSAWGFARFYLGGRDLSAYDLPAYEPVRDAPSAQHAEVLHRLEELGKQTRGLRGRDRLFALREMFHHMSDDADLSAVSITQVDADGVPGEWVVPTGRKRRGRLLYLHGGAFVLGSARGYRRVTAQLARNTGLDVLAIDYRLMPENSRHDGIQDCQKAYRWVLENGPDGPSPATALFVAGDSAGGNLTLMLIAWARDQHLPAPNGAIALSPATDATFASPSLQHNVEADPMLGPLAAMVNRVPKSILLLFAWLNGRIRPSHPLVSPVRGRLANLPPVLVQASEAEVLIDDARRYVNKARHEGSPAELETWHGMIHVWQAFAGHLPEADEAYARMSAFIDRCYPGPRSATKDAA